MVCLLRLYLALNGREPIATGKRSNFSRALKHILFWGPLCEPPWLLPRWSRQAQRRHAQWTFGASEFWPHYFTMIKVTPFSGGLKGNNPPFSASHQNRQNNDPSKLSNGRLRENLVTAGFFEGTFFFFFWGGGVGVTI